MLDSAQVQGALRKTAAAIIGFGLAMVLFTGLLVTGFYLLVKAAVLALSAWLGATGAMALVGAACLLLLALVFQRLSRPVSSSKKHKEAANGKSDSSIDALRNVIRRNPWEAVLMAFAAGIAEQGDPRLKSLLLQGSMILLKNADSGQPAPEEAGGDGDKAANQDDTHSPAQ